MTDEERFERAWIAMGDKRYKQYTAESEMLADTCEYLDLLGACYVREAFATKRGVADITLCYRGNYVAIECKDNIGVPSAQQKKFLKKVADAGGWAAVCRTLWDVKHLLSFCKRK